MKKQYLRKPNSTVRTNSGIVIFAMVALVVLLLLLVRLLAPGVIVALSAPLFQSGASLDAAVGNSFNGLGNASQLSAENKSLQEQLSTQKNENTALVARDQDLTKLLGGAAGSEGAQIVAGVLARPPESPYDTLIVAAGSSDGVQTSAEVFAEGGIPIGIVKNTTAHTATIELFSTSGVTTDGWIGDNRIAVTLAGAGAGAFSATLPTTAPISVGDSVYVPGPGAIPLGTISAIDTDPSSPTATLHIQPLVNMFSLTWVQIARS